MLCLTSFAVSAVITAYTDDAGHDVFLCCFGSIHLSYDLSLVHDVDPVTHADDFGELGRDHDDRLAGLCKIVDDAVDLILGTYVDTSRRFVEDKDIRVGEHPLCKEDLLLVTAGEIAYKLLNGRCLRSELLDVFLSYFILFILIDKGSAADTVKVCERCIS